MRVVAQSTQVYQPLQEPSKCIRPTSQDILVSEIAHPIIEVATNILSEALGSDDEPLFLDELFKRDNKPKKPKKKTVWPNPFKKPSKPLRPMRIV